MDRFDAFWNDLFAGLPPWLGELLATTVKLALVLAGAVIAYLVIRRGLLRLVTRLIRRTRTRWDDALVEHNTLRRASLLALLVLFHLTLPLLQTFLGEGLLAPERLDLLGRLLEVGIVFAAVATLVALLDAGHDIYRSFPSNRDRPIKGYVQIVQIFLWLMGGVLGAAIVLDQPVTAFLATFGALTAVILLIFRDTILSFVASLQIASYDLVRIGDWIEVPEFNADGDVVDVALHTIKVQNWDKTLTTVPTHKLVEGSFKNWRGMQESGGRRIKRSVALDVTSVRFLEAEDLDRFEKFVLLRDYIRRKREELEQHNRRYADQPELTANARRLTNLGTLRAYIAAYLRQRDDLHQEGMTFLVRQLPPGPEGVPLEIYVFTRTTAWAEYEGIQADIFDHVLAIVPEFDLRVFQNPTGHDLAGWRGEPGGRDGGDGIR